MLSRILIIVVISTALGVFSWLGCSGKTTVKEEMTDTSPRTPTSEEKKDAIKDELQSDQTTDDQAQSDETAPRPAPTPGENQGDNGVSPQTPQTPMTPIDHNNPNSGKTEEGGGREAREQYFNENMTYPGATEYTGMDVPQGAGSTSKTLVSNDAPGVVVSWYMNKLGDKASMSQTQGMAGEEYRITMRDNEKGYAANIIVSRIDKQNPTRIIINLRNT